MNLTNSHEHRRNNNGLGVCRDEGKNQMPEEPNEAFAKLIQKTDDLLWRCYHAAVNGVFVVEGSNVLFPTFADGRVRVSEQEAMELLKEQLSGSIFYRSVERPTTRNYSFTGKGKRSAATDLALDSYTEGRFLERFLNMEFKAHGVSPKRREVGHIAKDLRKLVLEPVNGFWFHTLEASNLRAISYLWDVLRREIKSIGKVAETFKNKTLTIHVCVLRKRISLEKTIKLEQEECRAEEWLNNVAAPDFGHDGVANVVGWLIRSGQ
jgi:hypothetical protein